MKLNNFYIKKSGVLSELIQFENQLIAKNSKENLLYKNALQKIQNEKIARELKEKRKARLLMIAGIAAGVILIIFLFITSYRNRSTDVLTNRTDTTAAAPGSVIYYIRSRHANLLNNITTGQVVYTLSKGTPLNVTARGGKYYSVYYNGSTFFVLASRLSLNPPRQNPAGVQTNPAPATSDQTTVIAKDSAVVNTTTVSSNDPATSTTVSTNDADIVFYNDNFSNNRNNWLIRSGNNFRFFLQSHQYEMRSRGTGMFASVIPTPFTFNGEYYIIAGLTHFAGDTNSGYGLVFSYKDNANTYMFEINADGYYRVCRILNNQFYTIMSWTPSNQILKGNGAENKLEIYYKGSFNCEFYINYNLVYTIDNFEYQGDHTGFIVENSQNIAAKSLKIGQ